MFPISTHLHSTSKATMLWLGVFVVNWFIQASNGQGQDGVMCETRTLEVLKPGMGEIKSKNYPNKHPPGGNCVLTILACAECNVTVKVQELSLPPCYTHTPEHASCIRGCAHLYMQDDSYPESTIKFLMEGDYYKFLNSYSRKVTIKYCSSQNSDVKFRLQYEVKEKLVAIIYSPWHSEKTGYIRSPVFPEPYFGNGDVYRYSFRAPYGHIIRLTFEDWSMSANSLVHIYYASSDSRSPAMTKKGTEARPFILTTGTNLFIRFETDHDMKPTYWGIKAKYEFIANNHNVTKPAYDFGRYFYNENGGVLTIPHWECWENKLVDTLWVAKTYNKYMYEYMLLQITSHIDIDHVEIREGTNSDSPLLIYRPGNDIIVEHGFYLRLKATCSPTISFQAIYTLFTNASPVFDSTTGKISHKCDNGGDFMCNNLRCIPDELVCDSHNHCGDNTDETIGCRPDTNVPCHPSFQCNSGSGRFCRFHTCDGKHQCADGTDELGCPSLSTNKPCPSNDFYACNTGYGRYCSTDRCDGHNDCLDGTDEIDCSKYTTQNAPFQHLSTVIPVVLICLALLLAGFIFVVYYARKRRRLLERNCRGAMTGDSPHNADHSYFAGLFDAPPPYEFERGTDNTAYIGESRLPGYTPPTNPPAYEEIITDTNRSTSPTNGGRSRQGNALPVSSLGSQSGFGDIGTANLPMSSRPRRASNQSQHSGHTVSNPLYEATPSPRHEGPPDNRTTNLTSEQVQSTLQGRQGVRDLPQNTNLQPTESDNTTENKKEDQSQYDNVVHVPEVSVTCTGDKAEDVNAAQNKDDVEGNETETTVSLVATRSSSV